MHHSADASLHTSDADEVLECEIDLISGLDDGDVGQDTGDATDLLTDEAEAMLTRARHVLIDNHVDLIEGIKAIERSRRAYDRGEPGQLLLITGASGTGKSTIQREWIRREYQRIVRTTGRIPQICNYGLVLTDGIDGDERPIVFVNASSSRSTNALATQILRALGAEVPRALHGHQILDRLRMQLVGQKTRLLFIDEFHHTVSSRDELVEELSELVKDLLVETRVQLVLSGMQKAARPVDANPQLDRRCRMRFPVEPFSWGSEIEHRQEFLDFLSDLEEGMDLPEASNLSDPKRAGRIHASTGGILGRVTRLILIALEHGLEDGVMHVADRYLAYAHETLKRSGERSNPFQPQASKNEQAPRRRVQRPSRTRGSLSGKPSEPTYEKTARTV